METDDNAAARPSPTGYATCTKPVSRAGLSHLSEIVPTTGSTVRSVQLPDPLGMGLIVVLPLQKQGSAAARGPGIL